MLTRLIAGLIIFHGIHFVPALTSLRDRLRSTLGHNGYMGLFSVVSLAALYLIVTGYGDARMLASANPQLWTPPPWTRHIVFLLMAFSFVLLAAAYIPSRIRTAARHPMMAAIKIWAFAHLLVRGDLASVLLFGSFLAYAVIGRISANKREAYGPLGTRQGTLSGDIAVIVVGLGAYMLMMMWGHAALIGVPLLRTAGAQ